MNKKTKTVLILLLLIVVLCTTVLLVACGKLSITGTWYSKSQGHYLVITRKSIIWGSWGNQTVITDDYTYADNIIRYDDRDKYVVSERGNVLYETKNLIAKNSNLPRDSLKGAADGDITVATQYFDVYNNSNVIIGRNRLNLFSNGTFSWHPYNLPITTSGVYKLKDGILAMYTNDQPYKFLYIDKDYNIYESVYIKDLDKYLPDGVTQYKWDILPSPYDPIPDDPVVNNPADDTPSPQTYTLTYLAGEGGYIQGDTVQSVTRGNDGNAVTAIPSEDSFFDGWDDNGLGIWKIVRYKFVGWSDGVTTATRLDTDVTQDITVTACFEKETETTYTLTYNASEGGRVEGNTTQSVAHGQDGSIVTAIADEGYVFTGWSDGVTTATRQDTNVKQNITATANFKKIDNIHLTMDIGDTCQDCGLEIYLKTSDAALLYNRTEEYLRAEFYGDFADNRFGAVSSLIKEIFIGESVTSIVSTAFEHCGKLVSVIFEEGSKCKSVGSYAFDWCTSLEEIVLPNGLIDIGSYAFRNCLKLTNIHVPDTVISVGQYAIGESTAWWDAQPNNELIYLGKVAYKYNGTMPFDTTITLREDTVGIADYCFSGQGFLREIKGYENLRHIGSDAFANCISLRNLPISDCLESIGMYAFNGCISIENTVIPKSLKSIGNNAFSGCTNLKEVFYKGTVEDWEQINVSSSYNPPLMNATHYYYSETEPNDYSNNYWHYDSDGNILIWKKEN